MSAVHQRSPVRLVRVVVTSEDVARMLDDELRWMSDEASVGRATYARYGEPSDYVAALALEVLRLRRGGAS